MSFTASKMWVSDYFRDEAAKILAGGTNVANITAVSIKLVADVDDGTRTQVDSSVTGTFNLEHDTGNTGRTKLANDLTFGVDGETVGGWVAKTATEDLFGANFALQEVYAGAGQFILEKDDTYVQINLGS